MDSLRVEVAQAQAEALRDTARIVVAEAAIIVAQDTVFQDLRLGLTDAQATLIKLRGDLQDVREARVLDLDEIARLRGMIAAGLASTKASRGCGSTLCELGFGLALGVIGWEGVR